MALHLSSDFNLKEWVSVVLLLTKEVAPLLERAERWSNVEAPTITYYAQKKVAKEGTVKEAVASDGTTIKVDPELWARLSKGYLLMIGDERIMVTAKGSNSGSGASEYTPLTVVRGWGNTPASAISLGAIIKILSKAESEFAITEDYKAFGEASFSNTVQTFTKSIYVTKEAAAYKHKTKEDLLNDEREAKFNEQLREINKTLYYWVSVLDSTTGEVRKTMGGWKEAINKAGGYILDAEWSISEDAIENVLLGIKQRGGMPEAIFLNSATKNFFRKVFKNKYIVEDRHDQGAGTRLSYFTSDVMGIDLPFIIDDAIETGDVFIGEWHPIVHVMVDPEENVDVLFTNYREPTNSQVIDETIKTTITAEFREASKEAYICNAYNANWEAPAKKVVVVNEKEAPVYTNEVATPTETETATETETETETESQ